MAMLRTLLALLTLSLTAFAADVTGTWSANVELDIGSGNPTFKLVQTGSDITGTYSGALGEAKVSGTTHAGKVEFSFEVSPSGDKVVVTYSGTLEGDKKMKGTVKLGEAGGGTFTATKN